MNSPPAVGHLCVEGWRPWSGNSCSNVRCDDTNTVKQIIYWCARCELLYEYAISTIVIMPTIWSWLMAHHGGLGRFITPQCPATRHLPPADIIDGTRR